MWREGISRVMRAGGMKKFSQLVAMQVMNPPIAHSELALDLKNVSKSYGETRALTALDLQCKPGTVHTIFGENGSGKSTLVKVLSGIIAPDQGEVWINGVRAQNFSPGGMRRLGIAAVLQEVLVAPNQSALQNIFLGYDGLFTRRIGRQERVKVAPEILAHLSSNPLPRSTLSKNCRYRSSKSS